MGKVTIFRTAEGWRHEADGVVSEDAFKRASQALADAGGDSLESVEIIYPEKDGRDTVPEEDRVEDEGVVDEGSEV